MAIETERVAGAAEIGRVDAAVRRMATDAGQVSAADRMELVRRFGVARFAERVDVRGKQGVEIAAMRKVTGRALFFEFGGVATAAKCGGLGRVALAAKSTRAGRQQRGERAGVKRMTFAAFALDHRFMLNPTGQQLIALMTILAIVRRRGGQGLGLMAVEFFMTGRAFALGHRLVRAGRDRNEHIVMAFRAGFGDLWALSLRLVGRMAGGAGGQFFGQMRLVSLSRIERLLMAFLANVGFG